MNNHIEVRDSNGVNIVYTEGPMLYDDEWRGRRRVITWALIGLIALGVILGARLVPVLLAAIAIAVLTWLGIKLVAAVRAADARYQARMATIAARADAEHAALMRGDLTVGLYGAYPPVQELNTLL